MKKIATTLLVVLILAASTILSTKASSSKNDVIVLTKSNHMVFSGEVNDSSVAKAQIKLGQLSKSLKDSDVIYLILDTPGGSISAGNLFIDYAKSLPQKIKPICLFCASMGYHFFQSFDERLVYTSSTLMSHRAALGGLSGQLPGEIDSRLDAIKRVLDQMDDVAANRVGLKRQDYRNLIHNELWLDGTTAVKLKHADRVAKIRCDNSIIAGTKNEVFNTIFGPVNVTFSTCPLIQGILDFKFVKSATGFRTEQEALAEVMKMKRKVTMEY